MLNESEVLTPAILGIDGIVPFPKYLVRNYTKLGVKPSEWSFYCQIQYLYEEGLEIPSQAEIGQMMGLTERAVKYLISDLRNKGFLNVRSREKKNGTMYDFQPLLNKAREFEMQRPHKVKQATLAI